jgi:hypothetical protein
VSSYFVSPSGDDSTGDGSYAAPFKTIAKAAAVAVSIPVDTIEIDAGVITETAAIASPFGFREIRGRGIDDTTVALNLDTQWLVPLASDGIALLIHDLHLETLQDSINVINATADDATAGHVTVARCRVSLAGSATAFFGYLGPDPQTFVPLLTLDALHCLVEGPANDVGGAFYAGVGSPIGVVAARNCIFTRLKTVNVDGTQPFDSDANVYFGNDRDLTLGEHGPDDVRGVDPGLVGATAIPLRGSPIVGAGVDLSSGYGYPPRTPPEEVGLTFPGAFPSIGPVEPVTPSARTTSIVTNLHTVVLALSVEAEAERVDLEAVSRNRALATADGSELARRWGALTGLRAIGWDVETYRRRLLEFLDAALGRAPTWAALRRIAAILFGSTRLIRSDYNKRSHFLLGTSLKLYADYTGGSPTWTYYLSAGELQLERRWLNVRQSSFVAAHADAVFTVYLDGSDPLDSNQNAKIKTSSGNVSDETRTQLAGHLTFRRGEITVTADQDLSDVVQPHRRIAHGFGPHDFVVESVDDARHLTLRYPYPEEDHVGSAWVITPNVVFGTVTIDNAAGVTDIECAGRIGTSTVPITDSTRGHTYDLTLDQSGSALAGATADVRLLFELLGRSHPIHKLGQFRLRDDVHALLLGQPWPFEPQSAADYLEIFDDPLWWSL